MENRRKVCSVLFVSCLLLGAAVGCSDGDASQGIPGGHASAPVAGADAGVAGATQETGGTSSVSTGSAHAGKTGVGGKSVDVAGSAGEGGEEEIAGGGSDAVAGETSVAGSPDAGVGGATGVGGAVVVGNGGTSAGVGGAVVVGNGGTGVGVGGKTGNGGTSVGAGGATVVGVGGATCAAYDELCTAQPCCDVDPKADRPLECDVDVCVYADNVGVGGKTGNGGTSVGAGGATVVGVGGAGVGGAVVCDPIPLAGPSGAIAQPFECTGSPVRNAAFDGIVDVGWISPEDILVLESGEILVSVEGSVVQYDPAGSEWSMTSVEAYDVLAVKGSLAKGVWVGGRTQVNGAFAKRLEGGDWVEHSVGLPALPGYQEVKDIYPVSDTEAYAIVRGIYTISDSEGRVLGDEYHSYLYRWNGTSWSDMGAPRSDEQIGLEEIWGNGSSAFVVSGGDLGPVVFRFDGCGFTDYTDSLPSDVEQIAAVSGNRDGEIYVAGMASGHGVVLRTTDLVGWTERQLPSLAIATAVVSPRVGASFVGGHFPLDDGYDWMGAISIGSESVWSDPVAMDKIVEMPKGFFMSGSTLWITTQYKSGFVGVYSIEGCQ